MPGCGRGSCSAATRLCLCGCAADRQTWFPQADVPIAQQITAQTATAGASFSAPGVLPIPQGVGGRESAETYLAVTGSWTELHLGASFAVLEAAADATLYIDCEHAQVWRVEADGTEVNMMGVTTGELPELRPGATGLQVGEAACR